MKFPCNYIRKFTPLSRFFGVTAQRAGASLDKSKQKSSRASRDSLLSFKDDEFRQGDFLNLAKLRLPVREPFTL